MDINLGRLGFVDRGNYSAATAYAVRDVVTFNGNTYRCIVATTAGQSPTSTPASWLLMASGPSGVMTTNGDLLYYNNGLQRLAAGSNGQALVMTGGLPAWGTGSPIIQVVKMRDTTRRTGLGSDNTVVCSGVALFNKQQAASKVWLSGIVMGQGPAGNNVTVPVLTLTDSANATFDIIGRYGFEGSGGYAQPIHFNDPGITGLAAGAVTWALRQTSYSNASNVAISIMNPDNNDDARWYPHGNARESHTTFTVIEHN
ncbi:carbohydrate-binding protein [Paramagnetospirillum magneticum]|uniref:Chitin-binding type-3 domain-containing protein n=1 Tax=Paramagnetospirillum magneticum (strain ATCC 700264 / AMB-1) TaxID=342108 RepID=Q2WA42_PARM1|nr:carbohydrate-binding protein [Paramagnetospirillum magneticum]BAE49283.1 hypothetical protein amb0479 [Paramagnetospirillum magneticum AMB-1]